MTRAARGLWCARAVTQHPLGPPAVRAAAENSESPLFTTQETTSAGPESRLYYHEMWLPGNWTLGHTVFEMFNRKQDQNTKKEEHCWQCLVVLMNSSLHSLVIFSKTRFRWFQESSVYRDAPAFALDGVYISEPCPNHCGGHGDCVSGVCFCDMGYTGNAHIQTHPVSGSDVCSRSNLAFTLCLTCWYGVS